MKVCPNCKNNVDDSAVFCTVCGTSLGANVPPTYQQPQPNTQVPPQGVPYYAAPVQPQPDPFDHTDEYEAKDIADNKLLAMLVYLFGLIGVVIALLSKRESAYLEFHIKQGLKLSICTALISILTAVLSWTCIVPVAGAIALIVLLVVQVICFFDVCNNKAKEAVIVRSLKFLN